MRARSGNQVDVTIGYGTVKGDIYHLTKEDVVARGWEIVVEVSHSDSLYEVWEHHPIMPLIGTEGEGYTAGTYPPKVRIVEK